jgi:hypothetical protein
MAAVGKITKEEKKVLKDLARRVKDLAEDPINNENRNLWRKLNSLKKTRPLVLCSVPPETWPELIPESSLICEDPFYKEYEIEFRKRIYRWEYLKDDDITTEKIYVPIVHSLSDWTQERRRPYADDPYHAACFEPCIKETDDLKKLQFPELEINKEQSEINYERVGEIFGDILTVIQGKPFWAGDYHRSLGWGPSCIDVLCELRGLEELYMDFIQNPGFVHRAMDFLKRGIIKSLEHMESEGIFYPNANETIIGSGHTGYVEGLPEDNEKSGSTKLRELWGFSQAQELALVSPEMVDEFVYPYQVEILEKFGLNYYGCCEQNDMKFKYIKKRFPRLRAIAVSPWVKHEGAVEEIQDKYVYSWKPNPTTMIATFDENYIRNETKRVFEITKNCYVAVALRDTQTLYGKPGRLEKWTKITKQVAMEYQ